MLKGLGRVIPGAAKIKNALIQEWVGDRLVPFKPTYNEDNLITDHWLTTNDAFEAAFVGAVAKGLALDSRTKWRVRVAAWAAEVGQRLGGAFVECGVAKGFMSRVILDYLKITAPFYLLDTYNGFDERFLSEEQAAALRKWRQQHGRDFYEDSYSQVLETFSDAPNVKIVRGAVPETLDQVTEDRIAYLSIDMNCTLPEIAAGDYFWPKMAKGAYIVLDDYGWPGHEEQRHAWDAWAVRTGAPLLSLPTGQGLIVKV